MHTIGISIIIIVGGDRGIRDTLSDLTLQKKDNVEILVIDSSGGKLNDIKESFPDVKWIDFKKGIRKITIPEQRNVGLKASKGNIILFIDASCKPVDNWIDTITKHIIARDEHIVAGSVNSSKLDKHHNLRNIMLKGKKYLDEAPTINLAMSREVVDNVGYFDESFDYGSDVDYTMRAIKRGYNIRYISEASITHDWGSREDDIKRAWRYGEARVNIYWKHRDALHNLVGRDYISLVYPLFILSLPIIIIWPYYCLVLLLPFVKNYNNDPIKTTSYNLIYGAGILKKMFQKLLHI